MTPKILQLFWNLTNFWATDKCLVVQKQEEEAAYR
jgi:hypothetical protein